MAEAVSDRIRRYILDGTDHDLRRLLSVSQVLADMTRAAVRRLDGEPGWTAIECGCGPLGGLPVLAELTGPSGRVVGVEVNPAAVRRARAAVSALELGTVEIVAGDLHEIDPATLGGPFDLAYTRAFLMHQNDPVRTLRRIADLLRPGGYLVAQEALRIPPPRSEPPLTALTGYWEVTYELLDLAGVPSGSVGDLPWSAREAGLEVTAMSGCFIPMEPSVGLELHAASAEVARESATRIPGGAERIDALAREIRAAQAGDYVWVSTPFFLDLTLRKPAAG